MLGSIRRSPNVPTPLVPNFQIVNGAGIMAGLLNGVFTFGNVFSIGQIGYTTTAGTAVVQSGTTGSPVTANAVCGNIKTVTASWTAGFANGINFVVTNSSVAPSDTIIVTQAQTTGVTVAFLASAFGVANGTFSMALVPFGTATSLASLNYAVIKAVTS